MVRIFILTLALLSAFSPVTGQNKGTGPREMSAKEEMRIRKQQKKESREKRKLEKLERKKVKKHHKRLQTKKVQKRMKKSQKTAVRNNENRREFFLKRWFSKKGRKGRPAKKND